MPSRYFRVPLSEIGYVRMIVDAYDGLAAVRSLGHDRGEIEWLVGEGMDDEAEALAIKLAAEIGMHPIPRPADWEDLAPAEPQALPLTSAAAGPLSDKLAG